MERGGCRVGAAEWPTCMFCAETALVGSSEDICGPHRSDRVPVLAAAGKRANCRKFEQSGKIGLVARLKLSYH